MLALHILCVSEVFASMDGGLGEIYQNNEEH